MEVLGRQVLIEQPDMNGEKAKPDAAKVLLQASQMIHVQKRRMAWNTVPGVFHKQRFLTHIIHYLSNVFKNPSLYETGKGLPVLQ